MASKDVEEGKVFAFLGVFLTLIGFLIVLLAKKDNKYAMYYAKQGLGLFIAYLVVFVAAWILIFIPIIGWLIMFLLYILLFVLWIIGIVYSLSGEMKPIPLIGKYAEKLKI